MPWADIYISSLFNLLDAINANGLNSEYFDWDNVFYVPIKEGPNVYFWSDIGLPSFIHRGESIRSILDENLMYRTCIEVNKSPVHIACALFTNFNYLHIDSYWNEIDGVRWTLNIYNIQALERVAVANTQILTSAL